MLHLCAALEIFILCVYDYVFHTLKFIHCAEMCTTTFEHLYHLTLCASLFPFLRMLHLCAVLVNLQKCVSDHFVHTLKFIHCAEVRMTPFELLYH